jgi:hypothetical protein
MIKVSIKGVDKVVEYLRTVPLGVKTVAGRSVAEYLVGNTSHGLKHYPPYKHVPYSAIGGFKSDKQRRYVMARIREGTIDPGYSASNGYLRDAWTIGGEPPRYVIKNDVHYAGFLVGDQDQSLHSQKQGWRTVSRNIADNIAGAIRAANLAIAKWLKEHK